MKEAFERLIEQFPKDISVLDVGVNGADGENTSNFLSQYFHYVTGITIDKQAAETAPPNYRIIQDNFYNHEFTNKFSLVVLDLTIESNLLNDWNLQGLERMKRVVKHGGYLINYVMMTTEYGDEYTPDLIAWHRDRWWKELTLEVVEKKLRSLRDWELITAIPETRRPYILWTLLKRIDG